MTPEEIVKAISGIPSWLYETTQPGKGFKDVTVLSEYASRLNPGDTYLEIGTAYGASAVVVALSSDPGVRIVTIDNCHPDNHPDVGIAVYKAKVQLNLNKSDLWKGRIEFIFGDANEIEWEGDIHALFIDGAHGYADVKKDFFRWSPFIPVGGYILFHDYEGLPAGKNGVNDVIMFAMLPQGVWEPEVALFGIYVARRLAF